MSTNKRHFRERFLSANRKMLQLLEKSKPTLAFYEHIILPVEVFFFKAGNYNGLTGRIYLAATNVFTITKYDGLDPEVFGGIDNEIYPRPFTIQCGLNLNF